MRNFTKSTVAEARLSRLHELQYSVLHGRRLCLVELGRGRMEQMVNSRMG